MGLNINGGMDEEVLDLELNGTWLAKVDDTFLGKDKKDGKVYNFKLGWVVIDEDSPFYEVEGPEWFKIYAGYTEEDREALARADQKKLKDNRDRFKKRMLQLGLSEMDLADFESEMVEGIFANVTWKDGWVRSVELIKDDNSGVTV